MKLVNGSPKQALIKIYMFSIQTFPSVIRYSCFYLPSASPTSSKFSTSSLKFTSPTYWPLCKLLCFCVSQSGDSIFYLSLCLSDCLSVWTNFTFLVKIITQFYLNFGYINNFILIPLHSNLNHNSTSCFLPQLGISNHSHLISECRTTLITSLLLFLQV